MEVDHLFKTVPSRDLFNFITGPEIGEGANRIVYEYEPNPKSHVIKFEPAGFQNVREFEIWQEIKDTKHAKWFAPCVQISPCGVFLIQERTEPIPKAEYPELVPKFLFDRKYKNYGVIKKPSKKRQFVCHDYGTFSLVNGYSDKLVKADWWE